MKFNNSWSIRSKLILLALITATVAVVITGGAMASKEISSLKEAKVERLSSQARMIAFNSTGVLTFLDKMAAKKLLLSFESEPTIEFACLYDTEGRLFACYVANGSKETPPASSPAARFHRYDSNGYLEISETISDQEIHLGTIRIRANSTDVSKKLYAGLFTILIVALFSLAAAVLFSGFLQRNISNPILKLSQTTKAITRSGDYSLRVEKNSGDELGQLGDAFNKMLSQVQEAKCALTDAHDELEERVLQRTAELEEVSHYNAAILEASLDAIIGMDQNGIIVEWNPQAVEIFGWQPAEVIGKRVSEIIVPPSLRQSHEDGLKRFLETGVGNVLNRRIEITAIRRDGSEFPIELALVGISDGDNRKFCGFIRDVTERRQTEEAMQLAKEAAEASNRAKSEFLANMSHEIRTPLNGILGFTDLMAQQGETITCKERAEFLSHIQVSGKHLLALINDILDLSKIESEKIEVELLDYSPHVILSEVMSLMRVRAKEKGLTLDSQWKGPLPKTIHTDPTRLRQILVNLVGNAIKFTQKGGIQLVAQIEQQEDGTNLLRVDVIDSGIGIPDDKIETIFAPFTQADNSVTREFGGTGLGLTISRQLARALGGDLTIDSCVGYGSTFTISINVGSLTDIEMLSAPPSDGIAAPEEPQKKASKDQSLTGANLLLVEDGEINQKVIIAILTLAGVSNIDTAENGEIGVRMAMANNYDLIMLDMQMPVMDGYTAATTLRKKENHTPIIALTAHAMKGDKEKCVEAGCNDYLSKPIVADDLICKIGEWLSELKQPKASDKKLLDTNSSIENKNKLHSTLPISNPIFLEIVQDFGELLENSLSNLRTAAENQEDKQLKSLAHNLLGTAGGAGFSDFTEPTRRLEMLAEENRYDEVIETLQILEALADRVDIPLRAEATSV